MMGCVLPLLLLAVLSVSVRSENRYLMNQRNNPVSRYNGTTVGNEKWVADSMYTKDGSMIEGTAAIGSNGSIYYTQGELLYCVSPEGEHLWVFRAPGMFKRSSPTVLEDGTVIVSGSSFQWGRDLVIGFVYSISPSGQKNWEYVTEMSYCASVNVADDGTIYVHADGIHFYALSPSGELLWDDRTLYEAPRSSGSTCTSPALAADGTIYTGSIDGYMRAFSSNGTILWNRRFDDFYAFNPPVLDTDGDKIYMAVDEASGRGNISLHCLSPTTGELEWSVRIPDLEEVFSPVVHKGYLYLAVDSYVYSIHQGKINWVHQAYDPIAGSMDIWNTPAIGANDVIYFGALFFMYGFSIADPTVSISLPPLFMQKTHTYASNVSPNIASDGTVYAGAYQRMYAWK
jgi:outer membrane protein assembly factor BamB